MRRTEEEIDDVPEPDEERVHAALEEWSRWCSAGGGGPGTCRSVEGRFRAPLGDLFDPPPPRTDVDAKLADRVNAAMLLLPPDYRDALVRRYRRKHPPRAIARACGVNARQYPKYMRACRLALDRELWPSIATG